MCRQKLPTRLPFTGEVRIRRPDTDRYVAWEVAGSSHTDYHNFLINGPIRLRDEGITGTTPDTQNCVDLARSRVNLYFVHTIGRRVGY
jgi:hypothetical protein